MQSIRDIDDFIKELRYNVVKNSTKTICMNHRESEINYINKSVNTPRVQKIVDNLRKEIDILNNTEIDYYLCFKNDRDYYFNKCIKAVELLGDLTILNDNWELYDSKKNLIWEYVGVLLKDDEMITGNNHK